MRNIDELNITGSRSFEGDRLPGILDFFDLGRFLGKEIPEDYVEFLTCANGGHPELGSIMTKEGDGEDINRFLALTKDDEDRGGIYKSLKIWTPYIAGAFLPIAEDGGGNLFFIDLDMGEVKMCIHDDRFKIKKIASSFSELIDSLGIAPDLI